MLEIRTNPKLLDALKSAAQGTLSAEELRRQKVSFIMGSLKDDSTITRNRVKEVLDSLEGRKAS